MATLNRFAILHDAIWSIHPPVLRELLAAGQPLIVGGGRSAPPTISRSVAVLPLFGTILPRTGWLDELLGAASTEAIGRDFDALLANSEVGAVILNVDSPGGVIEGVPELAAKIFAARGQKPIVAIANHWMASAAYWIGSAADEVVASPSATVGSIGVMAVHLDRSEANKLEGVAYRYVTSSPEKAALNPDEPPTEKALADLQARVDEAGEMFVKALAKQRGVTSAAVRNTYGQGRVMSAQEGLAAGLVDRIETLEETITRLVSGGKTRRPGARAEAMRRELDLEKMR
jgi:signal peptide peptidase SppA